jgi:peptidoglycan/xylan/chitin deacetylase (PgdA/CDA1 family)
MMGDRRQNGAAVYSKRLTLTFDNGPTPGITERVLDILARNCVQATFFVIGTEFKNPNFAAMAESGGIRGIRLEDPAVVEPGIAAALAHNGPVLIDAIVNRRELSIPPTITVLGKGG